VPWRSRLLLPTAGLAACDTRLRFRCFPFIAAMFRRSRRVPTLRLELTAQGDKRSWRATRFSTISLVSHL
jgi:hypothetical protein